MTHLYILHDTTPVPELDPIAWARWFDARPNRVVDKTDIGETHVSTAFLGVNLQWGDGPPLLFETMIFGGAHDGYQERCSTWEKAEELHRVACDLIRAERSQ